MGMYVGTSGGDTIAPNQIIGASGAVFVSGDPLPSNASDTIYGLGGGDTLEGGGGDDIIFGGAGKDVLSGHDGSDSFYFDTNDSGSVYEGSALRGNADIIWDFSDDDQIWLRGTYVNAGNTSTPVDGQYGIWQMDSDWVVTWNAPGDSGWHDVVVRSGDPHGDIMFY